MNLFCSLIVSLIASENTFVGSRLLFKNFKTKIFKTFVLHGCETWSLTIKEERRL